MMLDLCFDNHPCASHYSSLCDVNVGSKQYMQAKLREKCGCNRTGGESYAPWATGRNPEQQTLGFCCLF
eukprot:4462028-Pyramimonas_sp.AAC.1